MGLRLEEGPKQRFMAPKPKQRKGVEDIKEKEPVEKSTGKHFPKETKPNFLKGF